MARLAGELKKLCSDLGIPPEGSRDQMMNMIRDALVQRDKLNILPQIDVMAAQNSKDFLDYELEQPWRSKKMMEFWNDPQWAIEPKLDGCRVKAHFHPRYKLAPRLDSRRRSDVNFVYSEQSSNFPHLQLNNPPEDTILDGELMPQVGVDKIWNGALWVEGLQITTSIWNSGMETSQNLQNYCYHSPKGRGWWVDDGGSQRGCLLHYHAFDIIRYKGEWLYESPFNYRRKILEAVVDEIRKENQFFHYVPIWYKDHGVCEEGDLEWEDETLGRIGEFEQLIAAGGEGVMFKYLLSPYEFGKRSWSWMKLKKFVECSAYIVGSVASTVGKGWEDYIGAFEVAVHQAGSPIHIASVSAMSLDLRKQATGPDGKLNPEFLGKVVEIRFQQITSRSARGRHAVISRWRDDQTPDDCTFDQPGLVPHYSEVQDVPT